MTGRHSHPPVVPRRLTVAPDPEVAPVTGPDELVERLVAMAADVARLRHREVERVLGATVALALETVPGITHVGVLRWLPTGALTATAPSSEVAGRLDGAQVALGEGPGCDALHLLGASLPGRPTDPREPAAPREVDAPDLRPAAAAARRWPRFATEASRLDVAAVVALPLQVDPVAPSRRTAARRPLHVLSLYAHATGAFDPHSRVLARALAAHAAVALSAAQDAERIEEALRSRDTIGQAKGILMQRHGLDADGAFARLVSASQHANLRLRDVAAWLVDQVGSATPP